MFKKMIIISLMVLIIFMGVASASNETAVEEVAVDDNENVEINNEDIDKNIETSDNNEEPLKAEYSFNGSSYSELENLINNCSEGDVITLNNDINEGSPFVSFDKSITINGNGHTINANGGSKIFQISASNVVLNNITFIQGNSNTPTGGDGVLVPIPVGGSGLIYWTGANGLVKNCIFKDSYIQMNNGGAIKWTGVNGTVDNCIFENNTADDGGAIYWTAPNGKIINSKFFNNSVLSQFDQGNAVYWSGENGIVENCVFENNRIKDHEKDGSALYMTSSGTIKNSKFINNSNYEVYLYSGNYIFENNSFTKYIYLQTAKILSKTSIYVLNNSTVNATKNKNFTLTAIAKDDNNNTIIDSYFTFDILNESIRGAIDLDKGIFYENYTFKENGNFTVSASNEYYLPNATIYNAMVSVTGSEGITTIIIIPDNKFSRNATDFNAGERGAKFFGRLVDIDGNPLVNKTVYIAVNGPIYERSTDENGMFGHDINLAGANTYTYAIFFSGDENYTASYIGSTKLSVIKKTMSIAANNPKFKTSAKTKTVTATLYTIKNAYNDKMFLSSGKKVTLTVNGKTYTAKSGEDGVVKFNVKLTKAGTYKATIKFAGDNTYSAVKKAITITVGNTASNTLAKVSNKAIKLLPTNYTLADYNLTSEYKTDYLNKTAMLKDNVTIIIPTSNNNTNNKNASIIADLTFTRNATDFNAGERGLAFTGKLVDSNGNGIAGKVIQIAVNGPIYIRVTDENGTFSQPINLAEANTYTYALVFSGDSEYNAANISSSKLTVVKKTTNIKASVKAKTVTATLSTIKNVVDEQSYIKEGKKLTLTVNGKTYTAKTDAKGVATFKVSISKIGTYKGTVKFAGDGTYAASSSAVTIKI